MMWLRPLSWAALALTLVAGVAAAASVNDVARLLESSAAATRFEVRIPMPQLTPLAAGGVSAVRIDIEGWTPNDIAGQPELPSRIFAVAVPPTGTIRVSAVALDETVRDGVDVASVPFISRDGVVSDVAPEGAGDPVPASEWVRLVDVTWMRHQRIAHVEVSPVRYDGATRRLRSAGTIDVTVQAEGSIAQAAPLPEIDAFEPLYRELLVNYEQGRAWRSRTASMAPAMSRRAAPLLAQGTAQAAVVPDSSLYVGRSWVKLAVRRSGFYKLSFSQFKSLAPFNGDTTIVSDSLRLYTWGGMPNLPERTYCDTCGYREVAIGVIDDDTRMNHNSDAIYFYALGPSDWANRFDASQPDTVYINNPYETRNFYYLGFSTQAFPFPGPRRRIATRPVTPTGSATVTPATFTARVHTEQDNNYDPDRYPYNSSYAWEKWYWTKHKAGFGSGPNIDAPGADITQPGRLRVRLWSVDAGDACSQRQFVHATFNGVDAGPGVFGWSGYVGYTVDAPVAPMKRLGNSARIVVDNIVCATNTSISVYWFDLFYPSAFEPIADRLEFSTPAGGGSFLYHVGPFTGATPPRLFDVSNPLRSTELTGSSYTAITGGNQLAFESNDNAGTRYVALPDTGFGSIANGDVTAAARTSLDNLRSGTQQAEYLVIYYDPYAAAADTLAAWRRAHNNFRTKTVPISAIYDQFSGGRTDPTAIRNFLRAAYYNWGTQPVYVTLLGDASYDFKHSPGDPLPTFENNFDPSFQAKRQFTTDDWLFNVDTAAVIVPDFLGGRLPVPDVAGAMSVVRDKVLRYERAAPLGLYRNRIMLIADDNFQGSREDPLSWTHVQQTMTLDTTSVPSYFDRDYVYLHAYPTRTNFNKPDVRDTIVSHLEHEGVQIINFIGHGSPFKLADESVLISTDADALTNAARLPLFMAASCDVGRFSDPANSSLGEHLINTTAGGAIGLITSTDVAFSGANATLNGIVFRSLLGRDGNGEISGQVAAALLLGKQAGAQGNSINALKYVMFGDAAMRLNMPRYWVDLVMRDDAGADTTAIKQGHRISFTGRVLDRPNGTLLPLDGAVDVLVEDNKPLLQTPACPDSTHYLCDSRGRPYYFAAAGPIYRGTATATRGVFSGQFMVPLEARPGLRGRIRTYLSGTGSAGGATDAIGDKKLTVLTGPPPAGDVKGPDIRLSFANGATRVGPAALLHVDLVDSSGILITGHTPQNGIIVTVDGNSTSRVDLTDGFRYNAGSFQSGSVTFQLPNLAEGIHVIGVSAADNLAAGLAAGQHRSQASLEFEVVQTPPLRVLSSYLFPDPTRSKGTSSGGQFVVDTEGGPVDVQVRLFTVAGRLVRRLSASAVEGQVQLTWDGRDAEGQELANGVYLFKVVIRSASAGDSGQERQHDDAMGKFVIVNP